MKKLVVKTTLLVYVFEKPKKNGSNVGEYIEDGNIHYFEIPSAYRLEGGKKYEMTLYSCNKITFRKHKPKRLNKEQRSEVAKYIESLDT